MTNRFLNVVYKKIFLLMAFIALMPPVCVQAGSVAPVLISMKSQAMVSNEDVTLGEIAGIECNDAKINQQLQQLQVARVALPGQSQWVHQSQVAMRIRQLGLDDDQYRIQTSGPTKITRRLARLSSEDICKAVETFISKRAPWDARQMKISSINYRQDMDVPPGKVSYQITAPKHTDWLGSVPFNVTVHIDGQPVRKIAVSANIQVWSDIVLAAKPLGKNQPIRAGDIRTEKMNLARVPVNAIVRADQVIGHRANCNIVANSILRNDQVEMPPVVRKGDVVRIMAESDSLKVTTQGLAKEQGGLGDRIRVQNLRSKQTIYAQILDAQTVRVDF